MARHTTKHALRWAGALVMALMGCDGGDDGQRAPTSAGGGVVPVLQMDVVRVGIAASPSGRLFLAFSRAIDENEPFSVAELAKGGNPAVYPPGLAQDRGSPAVDRL